MKLGTHNSATGGKLMWWLKPLGFIINTTSKCQDKSIKEQLEDGVKVFNLQVAYFNGKWRFSHGLALYNSNVEDTIKMIKSYATKEEPIYIQIYLDRCFWCSQNVKEFELFVNGLVRDFCDDTFVMLDCWVEGTNYHPYYNVLAVDMEEKYWTTSWVKEYGESFIDKLPLPKRHSKKYNIKYKRECTHEYLMLDFYSY